MKDLIIIGGGPAGIQAGLVANGQGLDVLLIEKEEILSKLEGSIHLQDDPAYAQAKKLAQSLEDQGVEVLKEEVISASLVGSVKHVKISTGEKLEAKAVLIALGAAPVKSEEGQGFIQMGLDSIESQDFKDAHVFIYGDSTWLKQEVEKLLGVAKSITLLSSFSLQEDGVENLGQGSFLGLEEKEDQVEISYQQGDQVKKTSLDKPYILLSYEEEKPKTSIFIRMDLNQGYIETTDQVETNIPGVFAAGDIRDKDEKTIASALEDGKLAGQAVAHYLK